MDNNLYRCDVLFPVSSKFTYVNESLNSMSCIDYLISSSPESMIVYNVLDLDINLSNHLPIIAVFECELYLLHRLTLHPRWPDVRHFRWDHDPTHLYYDHTRLLLQPILNKVKILEDKSLCNTELVRERVNTLYDEVISALQTSADLFIPKCKKNFFKFWWDSELDVLRECH